MKFKQKQPVVQTAINNALSGGGTTSVYRRLGVTGGSSTDHSIRIIVVQID